MKAFIKLIIALAFVCILMGWVLPDDSNVARVGDGQLCYYKNEWFAFPEEVCYQIIP